MLYTAAVTDIKKVPVRRITVMGSSLLQIILCIVLLSSSSANTYIDSANKSYHGSVQKSGTGNMNSGEDQNTGNLQAESGLSSIDNNDMQTMEVSAFWRIIDSELEMQIEAVYEQEKADLQKETADAEKRRLEEEKAVLIQKKVGVTQPIRWGNRAKSEISLTFDDGYDRDSIIRVLDTLKKNNLKSTFFVIGQVLKLYPDLWKQAVKDGHQVCNHTQSHRLFSGLSSEDIIKEISGWEQTAKDVLGEEYVIKMKQEYPLFRLPGGQGDSSIKILKMVAESGYIPLGWSVETYYDVLRYHNLKSEAVGPIAEQVVRHVTNSTGNGAVVLLHFNPYDTTRLDSIIKGIQEKGLAITPVTDLVAYN